VDPLLSISTWFTVGGNGFSPISGLDPLLPPIGGTGLYVLPTTVSKVDVTAAVTLALALPPNTVLPLVLEAWNPTESTSTQVVINVPLTAASLLAATGKSLNVGLPLGTFLSGYHVGLRLNGLSPALVAVIIQASIFLHFHN
jgi:hypothetical protein